jgi:hypothetical protein
MWMTPEDARSDFILAAAATLFGPLLVALLASLPLYPTGTVGTLLGIVWVFVITALVPLLLVRYRGQGVEGYGLVDDPGAWRRGLLVALPIVVVGWLRGWLGLGLGPVGALAGKLAVGTAGSPAITSGRGVVGLALDLVFLAVVMVSGLMLAGFLVTRARDGFRRTELPVIEGLRTFGMGAAGAGLLLGLVASITPEIRFAVVLMNILALVVVVLLADRLVANSDTTSRATLLAPAVVAVVAQIMAFGGLFRGNLLLALFHGAISAGLVIVLAALIETRRYAWAVVPIAVASALYPTCLSLPVAFNASLIGVGC